MVDEDTENTDFGSQTSFQTDESIELLNKVLFFNGKNPYLSQKTIGAYIVKEVGDVIASYLKNYLQKLYPVFFLMKKQMY